jgi:eukaryotic-like serine/threonine-protein kinase
MSIAAPPIPSSPPDASAWPVAGGRYRMFERVGTGGMAIVHRAIDERTGHEVAVKLIGARYAQDTLFVELFRQEAELTARLSHPNVVAVLGSGSKPREFVAMELVEGLDAGRLLQRRGRLTGAETARIVDGTAAALAYVHEQDVVHCDVTPGNILVGSGGAVKVIDFGLASGAGMQIVARSGDVAGTPGYVAPEVVAGGPPTPRSDLYSLGMVTHRLLAGPPSAAPGAELPEEVASVLRTATAPAPGARHECVEHFRRELSDALSVCAASKASYHHRG